MRSACASCRAARLRTAALLVDLQESSWMLLLTVAPTAVRAEPVSSVAGTLVAPRIVVTILLTAVRATVTFVDI